MNQVANASALLATAIASMLANPAMAAEAAKRDTLSLNASATVEVPRDLMVVVLANTREGPDAASVQAALKTALDTALNEARKAAKPGQVDVQTGNFALYPRHNSKGGIVNWQGTAELQIEGRDHAAIAQLTGRITTMTIRGVSYNLSRESREKAENDVTAQAIARFKAKAADYTKQFGYGSYTLGEVAVNGSEPQPMNYGVRAQAMAMNSGGAGDALPTEAGKSPVTVSVNGTVQLMR